MQYEALNQWHFVIAAYAIGLTGGFGLVAHSWLAMRRAERRRDAGRERRAEPAQRAAPRGPGQPDTAA